MTKKKSQRKPAPSAWIFQPKPKNYKIDEALAELSELTWRVTRFKREINPRDSVFIWRAGKNAGIIAEATVTTPPDNVEESAEERRFYLNPEKFSNPIYGVRLHIDRVLSAVMSRDVLKGNSRKLAELAILISPQGTNFRGYTGTGRNHSSTSKQPGVSSEQLGVSRRIGIGTWAKIPCRRAKIGLC